MKDIEKTICWLKTLLGVRTGLYVIGTIVGFVTLITTNGSPVLLPGFYLVLFLGVLIMMLTILIRVFRLILEGLTECEAFAFISQWRNEHQTASTWSAEFQRELRFQIEKCESMRKNFGIREPIRPLRVLLH